MRAQTYLGVIAGVDSVINGYDVLFQKMKPVSFKANLETTNHENDHHWCTHFYYFSLCNIWKEQLCRISRSEFYEWLFRPEKFSGLSRNGSLDTEQYLLYALFGRIYQNCCVHNTWFIWISSVGTFSYPPDNRLSWWEDKQKKKKQKKSEWNIDDDNCYLIVLRE